MKAKPASKIPKARSRTAIGRSLKRTGSASALSLKLLLADVRRRQQERIQKAGKHECVKVACGTVARVTGRGGKTLKRPAVVMRFFECKLCGRDMTPNDEAQRRRP